ncbi:MAG: endolytic transglycosylase MltG [Brevundimonas sp.]|uniref:endolytic transglycosylase MltG n=1 Tax=Brevundimonas sp. TaxID=1871086 RepID=UPI00391A9EC0
MAGLIGATATLSLVAIAALVWVWSVYWGPGPRAEGGETTTVILRSGAGVSEIGETLHEAGVIRSPEMFRAAASLTGADRRLRAGEYEIESRLSLSGVIDKLVSGQVVRHFVTLPEGRSSIQAWDILNASEILTGEIPVPPEGSLLPETYEVTRGETRAEVVRRMQQAHDELLAELWAGRSPNLPVNTPEEAVILASIVEKETGLAEERPQVAAVFISRLRRGMRLESDPTIVYGVNGGRPLGRGIRRSELDRVTPYNTYRIDGLPPTPIANPGREALAAVLNPPETEYLFFVADGTGGHAFARTYEEHLANVARWRAIEARRAAEPAEMVSPEEAPDAVAGQDAPGAAIRLPETAS